MAAKNYGTIAIIPAGEWDNTKQYKVGRVVSYNGSSYLVHTLPPIGTLPTNTDYYQLSAQGGGIATEDSPGVVKPDNTTIDIDTVGTISAKKATETTFGITTSGDGTNIDPDGKMSVDTNFEQAVSLANIIANEAWANILGKISKSIAITMNLDENALLKAMMSNQYENVTTKAASAALVYNLKQSLDATNSNLTTLSGNLNNILPKKTYRTADGSFTSLNNLYSTQIATIDIGNDGSTKTPTGKDGLIIVFNHPATCVQLFFDWDSGFKRRILWNSTWTTWL